MRYILEVAEYCYTTILVCIGEIKLGMEGWMDGRIMDG